MRNLLFKTWMEFADYGFDAVSSKKNKVMGGTDPEPGDNLFDAIDASIILDELARLPAIGPNNPYQKWENCVEWGSGAGAVQVECTTMGSLRMVTRRKITDLQGQETWILKNVRPISDNEDEDKEISIAYESYDTAKAISNQMMDAPASEFEDFERLAWRLWAAAKKEHPSYCMFPSALRKQNENYYKLVFEFKGGGTGQVDTPGGVLKQFDIDLYWDKKKGLIRSFGYNIDTDPGSTTWSVNPSEWDEYFSPAQDTHEIIRCIIETFMQY